MIEIEKGDEVTYEEAINVTCTEKQLVDRFAGWVMETEIDETVNVSMVSCFEDNMRHFEGVLYPDQPL